MTVNHLAPFYFSKLENVDASNRRMSALVSASTYSDETTDVDTIRSFTEDEDVVIMVIAQVTKKVKLLHSTKNLGGHQN